jgi:ubiquinone/menaquinone biosynthesis C-methylase UbiE
MKTVENRFDLAAATWDKHTERAERTRHFAQSIRSALPLNKGVRALELGCGTGNLAIELEDSLGYILGLDSSREMIKEFLLKISRLGLDDLDAVCADIMSNDLQGDFDLIYSAMALHHMDDIDGVLTRLYSLIAPGGRLLIIDLYCEDGSFHGSNPVPHNGFNPDTLADWLHEKGFSGIEFTAINSIEKELESGEKRSFPLFMCTARKA